MVKLVTQKVIRIIAAAELEPQLTEVAKRHSITGYTVIDARAGGASGIQPGLLDIDSSILFLMVTPPERLDETLEDLAVIIRKGHHLLVLISNVDVMRRKDFPVGRE